MPEGTYREVYEPKVREAAQRYGVPEHILVAMIAAESKFDPYAINHASGASGIAQLMPDTAAELGVDPFDPGSGDRRRGALPEPVDRSLQQ